MARRGARVHRHFEPRPNSGRRLKIDFPKVQRGRDCEGTQGAHTRVGNPLNVPALKIQPELPDKIHCRREGKTHLQRSRQVGFEPEKGLDFNCHSHGVSPNQKQLCEQNQRGGCEGALEHETCVALIRNNKAFVLADLCTPHIGSHAWAEWLRARGCAAGLNCGRAGVGIG